jgi:hypothetical protein
MATTRAGIVRSFAAPSKTMEERRTTRRYNLSLRLALLPFSDLPGTMGMVPPWQTELPSGHTRDVSTGGIYFFTSEEDLPAGSELAFTIILPAELTHGKEVFVCAQGKVVRTEKKRVNGRQRTGVAARIERYEIVKEDPLYLEFFGPKPAAVWPASTASL